MLPNDTFFDDLTILELPVKDCIFCKETYYLLCYPKYFESCKDCQELRSQLEDLINVWGKDTVKEIVDAFK